MKKLPDDPEDLIAAMKESNTIDYFEEMIIFFFENDLQNDAIPKYFIDIKELSTTKLTLGFQKLYEIICWYTNYISTWPNCHELEEKLLLKLRSILNWYQHEKVNKTMEKLFSFAFQYNMWQNPWQMGDEMEGINEEEDQEDLVLFWKKESVLYRENNEVLDPETFGLLMKTWLPALGLIDEYCKKAVLSMLEIEINRFVVKMCKDEFDQRWIDIGQETDLKNWLSDRVMPWITNIFGCKFEQNLWMQRIEYILYSSYTQLRITEMLNIITEYPDSCPVIEDLKICLNYTRQRPCLIESLKCEMVSRVLHPGVSTQNIITVYISAVKALRELDPSGVVMEMVLEPCKTYLTQRDDAVRMIMEGLLGDDGANDLASELASSQEQKSQGVFWSERKTVNPEDWMPDPREADPNKVDKSSRTSDIVTLFIGMYGSKERFIKEYQKLLSKRLLQTWYSESSDASEIRNLELLKMRFGEEEMGKCSVMLKDIADSKRINNYVKNVYYKAESEPVQAGVEVRPIIISSEFWPQIPTQEFQVPDVVEKAFDSFNKGYEKLKASRSLCWLDGAGTVELELQMKDRLIKCKATPLQASIIYFFQEKDKWTLFDLASSLKVTPTLLKRKIAFWIQQGVLRESGNDVFEAVEQKHADAATTSDSGPTDRERDVTEQLVTSSLEDDDEEGEEDPEAENAKRESTEKMFWNYVQGMLKNFESLPLERIHKMLQMFALSESDVQIELNQLRQILNQKVTKGLLTYEQGKYKLVRDVT